MPWTDVSLNLELVALGIAIVALLISILAARSARAAWLSALRTEVRWELDSAVVDASWLVDKAVKLTEDTMKAAYELRRADGSGFRPNEREAFDLRDEAGRPMAELQQINPQMTGKSWKQLEATRTEVARIRRTMDEIGTKIDVKNAALERLLDKTPARDVAPDRKPVFVSSLEARPAKGAP